MARNYPHMFYVKHLSLVICSLLAACSSDHGGEGKTDVGGVDSHLGDAGEVGDGGEDFSFQDAWFPDAKNDEVGRDAADRGDADGGRWHEIDVTLAELDHCNAICEGAGLLCPEDYDGHFFFKDIGGLASYSEGGEVGVPCDDVPPESLTLNGGGEESLVVFTCFCS